MTLRSITHLFLVISAFGLTIVAPISVVAETFIVVVNANNRVSGSDAELREVVRQLYLKEEVRWPDDLPSLPLARPDDHAAHEAFTQAVLGVTPEQLESHWAERGEKPPKSVGPVPDLLRLVSRNKGAFSIVAGAEAKKLPAKVRVLFEFTKDAPAGDTIARLDGTWVLEVRESDQPPSAAERQLVQIVDHKLFAEISPGTWSGTIAGEIDASGHFVGYALLSQLKSRDSKDKVFKVSAAFNNGAFKTTAIGQGTATWVHSIEIKLTPEQLISAVPPSGDTPTAQPETAALSPSTETAPSQTGLLDGTWVASSNFWKAELQISGREYDMSLKCSGNSQFEVRGKGQLDEEGRIELTASPGSWRQTHVVGTLPTMQVIQRKGYCPTATLELERVGGTELAAASSQTGSFDGNWQVEFEQLDGPFFFGVGEASRVVAKTNVISNEFSTRFQGDYWQGEVSGHIDESGVLVASGWVVRKQYAVTKFSIEARYSEGAFRAEFDATNIYGDRARCRIALIPAG